MRNFLLLIALLSIVLISGTTPITTHEITETYWNEGDFVGSLVSEDSSVTCFVEQSELVCYHFRR